MGNLRKVENLKLFFKEILSALIYCANALYILHINTFYSSAWQEWSKLLIVTVQQLFNIYKKHSYSAP